MPVTNQRQLAPPDGSSKLHEGDVLSEASKLIYRQGGWFDINSNQL